MIYRRCLKLLRDPSAAQDATQEVFIRLMSHVDGLEPGDGYLAWIYRVATNHCLNVLRDEARLELCDPAALPEVAVEGGAAHYPEREISMRVLRRFDAATRSIAVLALVDGSSQEEIAEVLGISRKTVGKKLRRFLARAPKLAANA